MKTEILPLADLMLECASICEALAAAHARELRSGERSETHRELIAVRLEDLAEQVRGGKS